MESAYKNSFEERYCLPKNTFMRGFWRFLGIEDDSYLRAIRQIKRRSVIESFRSDATAIAGDFKKVIDSNKQFDVAHIEKRHMVDAC